MITDYLPQLLLAWSIQWMGVISPGPSVVLIMGVAMNQGRLPSVLTAFGIACASIILSSATVLGIAVVFAQMAELIVIIRLVGASYLAWLAYKAFRNATLKPDLVLRQPLGQSAWRTGLTGFFLQLSNPKAIFFWLAIAGIGGVGDAPPSIVVLFVAVAFVNSFVGHGGYALLLSSGPIRRTYLRFRSWIESTLGCFFCYSQATSLQLTECENR